MCWLSPMPPAEARSAKRGSRCQAAGRRCRTPGLTRIAGRMSHSLDNVTTRAATSVTAVSLGLQATADLPEIGQLATVRGRNWVVVDRQASALPLDVTATHPGEGATMVTLSSVEDDGLGQELRVLWELEPGRRVLERATLRDVAAGRFDDPATLGAFLDALR